MKLQQYLKQKQEKKSAVLAINFYNYETLCGILTAFAALKEPVILQTSKSTIDYLGLDVATQMGRAALDQFGIQGWLHLDHASSVDLVKKCLDAGYDSVMIDASELTFNENIKVSAQVVKLAQDYQAHVEAELGYVAKLGQEQLLSTGYTDPDQAAEFVQTTGIDSLAIAIGTAHGFYKSEPNLDLARLEKIRSVTDACLVLHGGSGIPVDTLRAAVKRGICKINLATEIKNVFMRRLKSELSLNNDIDLRNVFPPAIEAVKNLVINKYQALFI
jgi:fructose-bisphosphate aldolase class II/tagatose 1,6-diphosphate aldolase GatY/KbaY